MPDTLMINRGSRSTTTIVVGMTSIRQRRTRGGPAVQFNTRIDPTAKAKIDKIADALRLSQGQVVDLLLGHVEVDAHGRPDFWDGPLPTDAQKELPLAKSA